MPAQRLSRLVAHRGFITASVKREFQLKYRNSLLGASWTILNPLAMIIIYTLVFSRVMQARIPGIDGAYSYSVFLCTGVLLWGLFSEIVQRTQSMFVDNANVMKKINFPWLCLPTIVLGSAVLNFLIIFGLFALFLVVVGLLPGLATIALVPIAILLMWLALSLGVALAVLNVFFRDVGHLTGIALQFWFWLTPIVYPASILPERVESLLWLNPIATCIVAAQQVILVREWPSWSSMWFPLVVSAALTVWAWYLFRAHEDEIVDEL